MVSLKESLFSISETLLDTLKLYKKAGVVFAEEAVQQQRIKTCAACPFFTDGGRCEKCGCFMSVKVRIQAAKCPALKW